MLAADMRQAADEAAADCRGSDVGDFPPYLVGKVHKAIQEVLDLRENAKRKKRPFYVLVSNHLWRFQAASQLL